jgi:hypothetical protein
VSLRTVSISVALFIGLVLTGCGLFDSEEEGTVLAKVGKHVLLQDEVQKVLPQGLSTEDSTLFVENFIRQWATRQLMVDRAELNLSSEQKDVTRQLEEYRQSLIVYLYQTEWVRQEMDTTVSDAEIAEHYDQHTKDLGLQEDIVRALYIKVDLKEPELDNLRKWIKKDNDPELRSVLEGYCSQHALAMHMNDQQWLPLERLLTQLPQEVSAQVGQVRSRTFIDLADTSARYLIDIKQFKAKNETAPLDYVKDNIASVILNRRKLDMLRKLERDIYEQAVSKGKVEILP